MTPLDAMSLFPEFRAPSWSGWRDVVGKLTEATREFFVIAGRGSGKSRIVALLATAYAVRTYDNRAPGERVFVGVFAPDRRQAKVTFRYVAGLLKEIPELHALIESERAESLDLKTGVTIEVLTATRAAPRGRSYALAIVEEASFQPQDESASPDVELIRALRPALARLPGSLLAVVSSPYARRGVLFEAWRKYKPARLDAQGEVVEPAGPNAGDPAVLLVHASTEELNPTFDAREIERAHDADPVSARTEYNAEFRSDVESFVSRESVEACVVPGRLELPPIPGTRYIAFVDPSGGQVDSMTLGIAHLDNLTTGDEDDRARIVLDLVRERKAPFSPEDVVRDFAAALKPYGISTMCGDRYAGQWPAEAFKRYDIRYEPAPKAKSDLYRDALPLLNSGRVELLDIARITEQMVGLERKTARGGRDSIDHAPGGHDDVANAVAGALVVALESKAGLARIVHLTWG